MTDEQQIFLGMYLGRVVKPEGLIAWLDVSVPRLNGATPRQFIEAGDIDRVIEIAKSYSETSYT